MSGASFYRRPPVTDQAIAAVARSLAAALIEAGYARSPDAKREVARLQTELCAALREEQELDQRKIEP
jgi:hypothetical protein